ncbi:dihydroneopterin aldolase [Prosthecochloris sp. N3]|uniref:7,8-dihydroneopterin aldolase n=1 Tax=Prosthecochloris ethylica TaxID=2743976 RepID=A0ABR9XNV3_9CHLB|nr:MULTISPECIES: dihydroneopterin aldolase [Prosthecochloris]MBF0585774.1 dihydroneopterin aldolase [Prosthecochloris ethylica]MBF0635684.1 dihydroneopterin aldolase [Prosthecochloris ethylica]NUK46983.1 dihydroneopterin aldolase [Prosthecochloris ethylica]RNA65470.1 dihydroneopterin aldolase [Prosthecochloris sp. ZM_2]
MNTRKRSCIRLMNVTFYAHHGVHKEEHVVGGKYEVDAEMNCDFTDAAQADDITRTVDYATVYRTINDVLTKKKYYLIEAVAFTIAEELVRTFTMLETATIRVRKRNPPVGGVCDYAEAEYTAYQPSRSA